MSMSLTPASYSRLIYCGSDKKSYIIDDYETQTPVRYKKVKGKVRFRHERRNKEYTSACSALIESGK